MRFTEVELLRSEIGTVEGFLAETPEDAIIMRMTWEGRLEVLHERLAAALARPQAHPLSITFRGTPVDGMRSIDATFASKAVRAFVDAADTVTASVVSEALADRGRLPSAGARALRIVSTAVGSFGFELELPPAPPETLPLLSPEETDPYVEALRTTLRFLDEAAANNEEALSDLIAQTHPRAATKIREFAEVLAKNGALFAVAFQGEQVRFDRPEQVRRVMDSLAETNISEEVETQIGTLEGLLPRARSFEAKLADGQELRGQVDRVIPDLKAFKRHWEDREAQLSFRVIRVRTRTRYVLTGAEALSDESAQKVVDQQETA